MSIERDQEIMLGDEHVKVEVEVVHLDVAGKEEGDGGQLEHLRARQAHDRGVVRPARRRLEGRLEAAGAAAGQVWRPSQAAQEGRSGRESSAAPAQGGCAGGLTEQMGARGRCRVNALAPSTAPSARVHAHAPGVTAAQSGGSCRRTRSRSLRCSSGGGGGALGCSHVSVVPESTMTPLPRLYTLGLTPMDLPSIRMSCGGGDAASASAHTSPAQKQNEKYSRALTVGNVSDDCVSELCPRASAELKTQA
jgi:hypothetical protein